MGVIVAAVKLADAGSMVTVPAPVNPVVLGAALFWNTMAPAVTLVAPV